MDVSAKSEPAIEQSASPDAQTLVRAEQAFERGDFATARNIAAPLFTSQEDGVATRARELDARLRPDRIQLGVLLGCLVLFAAIVYVYVLP